MRLNMTLRLAGSHWKSAWIFAQYVQFLKIRTGRTSRVGIDLEFTYNGIKPFGFTKGDSVDAIVADVEDGGFSSVAVPGPIGVTGRLRNLYIDEDIRIAEGVQLIDSDVNARDVYIQERSDVVD